MLKEKRFIADASHELRTPLSVLQIHTDNLRIAESPKAMLEASSAIQKSTKRLSHLVYQLMETQKLEHIGNLGRQAVGLLDLIEDAMAHINSKHLDNVEWEINIDTQTKINVEPALFQSVLRNLLDNAAKYAEPGSIVSVKLEQELGTTQLSIRNIIKSDSFPLPDRLGERFFRHASHQDIEGSGLGLSIVQKIIELHQMQLVFQVSDKKDFIVTITL